MCESAKQERDTLIFICMLTCSTDLVVAEYNAPLASLACTVIRAARAGFQSQLGGVVIGVAFLRHL